MEYERGKKRHPTEMPPRNPGYDVKSRAEDDGNVLRFIEVKGSKGADLRFVWSSNEIEVARKFGAKYWIYFIGGIDVNEKTAKFEPLLFQDPHNALDKDERLTISPNGMVVQGRIRGELKNE